MEEHSESTYLSLVPWFTIPIFSSLLLDSLTFLCVGLPQITLLANNAVCAVFVARAIAWERIFSLLCRKLKRHHFKIATVSVLCSFCFEFSEDAKHSVVELEIPKKRGFITAVGLYFH